MTIDAGRIERIVASARARIASHPSSPAVLLETEGLELLQALGIRTPAHVFVTNGDEAAEADTSALGGDRVVVKVVSPHILHKSDVGGVKIVENRREAVAAAVRDMEARLADREIAGFTINEFERYDATLGGELLLGLRWTVDFGPVVTLGAGGIHAEFLAENLKPGREIGVFSRRQRRGRDPGGDRAPRGRRALATGGLRGPAAAHRHRAVVAAIERFAELASRFAPHDIAECEINPLVITPDGLVALDILVKLGSGPAPARPARPLAKLRQLLEPASVAIIGVSEKLNPGHIILNNLHPRGVRPLADLRRQAGPGPDRGLPGRAGHPVDSRAPSTCSSSRSPPRRRRR